MPDDPYVEEGHIGALSPDPSNPRRHTPRNIGMIERSLSETGAGRSVTADRKGRLISGNATVEAAALAGIENAILVHTRGEHLIVHVRDDLDLDTDPAARKLSIADNRTAELAEWDTDILAGMKDLDILANYFTEDELRDIVDQQPATPSGGGGRSGMSVGYRVVATFDTQADAEACLAYLEEGEFDARIETT